jgi:hypothetical protein
MTIDSWLQAAVADAERRGLPELKPVLETLARATTTLRAADFNDRADGEQSADGSRQSPVASRQSSADSRPSTVGDPQS